MEVAILQISLGTLFDIGGVLFRSGLCNIILTIEFSKT